MTILNQVKVDDCKYEISFSYDQEKVEKIVDDVAREIGKEYKIKGYRPGKADANAVKLAAKKFVLENASKRLANEAFQDILFETKWKPFSPPQVTECGITLKTFTAKFIVNHTPNIELTQYKDFELPEPKNIPTVESIVDKFIENICSEHAVTKPFTEDDFVLINDSVVINFHGTIDGKEFENNKAEGVILEIGKGVAINGFEDNLIGMKPGEKREFDITFDETMKNKSLINKTAKFEVELVSAARKEPTEFNDDVAKKMNFENIDALKTAIVSKANEQRQSMMTNVLKQKVLDLLIEKNQFDIPQWMIKTTAETTLEMQKRDISKLSDEEKESLFKDTKQNIQTSFILNKIKELEVETVLSDNELYKLLDQNIGNLPPNIRKEVVEGKNMALYSKLLNDTQMDYIVKWIIDHSKLITATE